MNTSTVEISKDDRVKQVDQQCSCQEAIVSRSHASRIVHKSLVQKINELLDKTPSTHVEHFRFSPQLYCITL